MMELCLRGKMWILSQDVGVLGQDAEVLDLETDVSKLPYYFCKQSINLCTYGDFLLNSLLHGQPRLYTKTISLDERTRVLLYMTLSNSYSPPPPH